MAVAVAVAGLPSIQGHPSKIAILAVHRANTDADLLQECPKFHAASSSRLFRLSLLCIAQRTSK